MNTVRSAQVVGLDGSTANLGNRFLPARKGPVHQARPLLVPVILVVLMLAVA